MTGPDLPAALVAPNGAVVPVLGGEAGAWRVQTPCGVPIELADGRPLGDVDVVIDPGHGGDEEPGAVGPLGLQESDLNLDVSERLADWLEARGHTTVMVRTDDYFMRIPERLDLVTALAPDVFVSIHHNGGVVPASDVPGVQTFHQHENSGSERLAVLVHAELTDAFLEFEDVYWTGALIGAQYLLNTSGTDYYGVLRRAPDVVSVLVEGAWLTNPEEERLLWRREARQAEAEAIGRAIERYLTESEDERDDGLSDRMIGGRVYEGSVGRESEALCVDEDLSRPRPLARLVRGAESRGAEEPG